jgi:hypothetical protein
MKILVALCGKNLLGKERLSRIRAFKSAQISPQKTVRCLRNGCENGTNDIEKKFATPKSVHFCSGK